MLFTKASKVLSLSFVSLVLICIVFWKSYFIVRIVYNVLRISICFFMFFYVSAIINGELLYRRGIRKKLNMALRPKKILMVSSLRKIDALLKAHHNIMFYYIYLRVKKDGFFRRCLTMKFFYRVLFLLLTGVSWFLVVLITKIINSPKLEIFILKEFYNNDGESLLLLSQGVWDYNGIGLEKIKSIAIKSCGTKGVPMDSLEKSVLKIEKILLEGQEKRNFMYKEFFSLKWGKVYGKDSLPAHMITNNFTTNNKIAFFTDEKKNVAKGDYNLEKIINKVEIRKDTAILAQEKENLYIPRESETIYLPKILIASGALKHGYASTNMQDEFKSNLMDLKIITKTITKECVDMGLDNEETREILNISSIIISGI